MAFLNASNDAGTQLIRGISSTDTTLEVADASKFPSPPFLTSIDDEIIKVTSVEGNTFGGLERGQEGTTPASHAIGSVVENRFTAGMYHDLTRNITQNKNDLETHKAGNTHIPKGLISMWSGTIDTIPEGWALCDGEKGTPDLRNRFVMGASDNDVGETGGENEVTLTGDQMPPHKHSASTTSAGGHTHDYYHRQDDARLDTEEYMLDEEGEELGHWWKRNSTTIRPAGSHTHSVVIGKAGKGQAHENRPAYFKLAFIMKL